MIHKLVLRPRQDNLEITLTKPQVKRWMEGDAAKAKESLYAAFTSLRDMPGYIHDYKWLDYICAWRPDYKPMEPPPLITLKEALPWLNIVRKLGNHVESEKDFVLALKGSEVELIWARLNSPEFKIVDMHHCFAEFIVDFAQQTGHAFASSNTDEDKEEATYFAAQKDKSE